MYATNVLYEAERLDEAPVAGGEDRALREFLAHLEGEMKPPVAKPAGEPRAAREPFAYD